MAKERINPYEVLGLKNDAGDGEIRQAYFALVRANPPERAPQEFKRIRAAYERLRDPQARLETDMTMLQPLPESGKKRRPPKLDLTLQATDVLQLAWLGTDLDRQDWRDSYHKVEF